MPRVPDRQGDKLIERELLTVVVSLRLKLERREAVFSLLNHDEEAPVVEVMKFFLDLEELDEDLARRYWRVLLKYRREMTETYGDRVSLNIATYNLTRDPETLESSGLPQDVSASKLAQTLAIQELKAWWERNSETGVYLREVMDQQLERLVHHGMKNRSALSFVLIRIRGTKGDIDGAKRMEMAQFLMDGCRCRDIVGHYQGDHYALILPQTPRAGARVAIERLEDFFRKRFGEDYLFDVAVANCSENGGRGRDLAISALDALKKNKGKNLRIECEGEPRPLYVWWVYEGREPILRYLKSPVKLIATALLIALTVFAAQQINLRSTQTWSRVVEARSEHPTFMRGGHWGRGGSEDFKLEEQDGFFDRHGNLIIEDGEDLWFNIPFEARGHLRMSFTTRPALGSTFVAYVGTSWRDRELELRVGAKRFEWRYRGVIMSTVLMDHQQGEPLEVEFWLDEQRSRCRVNGRDFLTDGPWIDREEPWPGLLFFRSEKGHNSLVGMSIYERRASKREVDLFDKVPLAHRMLNAAEQEGGLTPWLDLMEDNRETLSAELIAQVQEEVLSLSRSNANDTLKTLGRHAQSLDMLPLWPILLRGRSASIISNTFSEGDLARHRTLAVMAKASRNCLGPVFTLSESLESGIWGDRVSAFLDTVAALDWGREKEAVSTWLQGERIRSFLAANDANALAPGADLLKSATRGDSLLDHEVIRKLLPLSTKNPTLLYPLVHAYFEKLEPKTRKELIEKTSSLSEEPTRLFLEAIYESSDLQRLKFLALKSWMNASELGKVLYFDWLAEGLKAGVWRDREKAEIVQTLTRQSRRPLIAREVLRDQGDGG